VGLGVLGRMGEICAVLDIGGMGERVDARITRFLCDTREVELLS
jgi:hypothetical protein